MLPLLFVHSLLRQTPPQPVPASKTGMYVALTFEGDRGEEADRERREIVAGSLKGEDAKTWIVREKAWYLVLIRKNLVDDRTCVIARTLLDTLKTDRFLPECALGSMSAAQRKDLAEFLAQTPLGRFARSLNRNLRDPRTEISFEMSMSLTVEDGFGKTEDASAMSLLSSQEKTIPTTPDTAYKGFEIPEEAQSIAMRFPSGLTNRFRSQCGTDALELLEALRKERLDRLRADLEQEGWRRVSKLLANARSWDGRRPITFGELDPVLQKGLRLSNDRKFQPGDKILGAIFGFDIYIRDAPDHRFGTAVIPRT